MLTEIPPGMTYAQFRKIALDLPALESPNGNHNYLNPPNLVNRPAAYVQWILASILVLIRLYTKVGVVKKVLIEDYWLLAAWLVFVGAWIPLLVISQALPHGVHQWDMTVRTLIKHLYSLHLLIIAYSVVIMLLKVSIILQIIRIFLPRSMRKYTHWLLLCFMWINVLFYTIIILYLSFSCKPIAKSWDPLIPGGHCNYQEKRLVHIISAAINMASDVVILIIPQPVIWGLNMTRKRKWGLSAMFLVGTFACVAATVRMYYTTIFYRSHDVTYWAVRMGKWAEIELTAVFIVACLPAVPAFIKHIAGSSLVSNISSSVRSRSTKWTTRTSFLPYASGRGTQGEGKGKGDRKIVREIVTDIEFHDLVARSRTDVGSVRSEGGGSADLEGGQDAGHGSIETVTGGSKLGS